MAVRVNNKTIRMKAVPGTFLRLDRTWREGDTIAVSFPMALHFKSVDEKSRDRVALMYGPLLMVALADKDVDLPGDAHKPEQWMHLKDKSLLTFEARDGSVTFRPLYLIHDERYTTYCHVPL